jgi:hypothetical protein
VNVAPVLLVVAVLAVATGLGLWWRARNGRYTAVSPTVLASAQADTAVGPDEDLLSAAELGAPHGTRATFVQLSSAVCAPCRRMHAVLADLAGSEPGVVHVDLVRRFQVLRTPTTLVLDARGVVVGRLSGAADRRQVHAALDAASCPDGAAATR